MTRKQFAVIAARLKEELKNIKKLTGELADKNLTGSKKKIRAVFLQGDTFTVRAVGSILHDFYVAAENMFKIIAREMDEKLPAGDQWHRELLIQMTLSIPGVRPPFLSQKTAGKLDEFRAFRHVFRNVYGFNLVQERITELVNQFPGVVRSMEKDIGLFIETMQNGVFGED